jgi:hypothetical protein
MITEKIRNVYMGSIYQFLLLASLLHTTQLISAQVQTQYNTSLGGGFSSGGSYSNFSIVAGSVTASQLLGNTYVANVGLIFASDADYAFPGSKFTVKYNQGTNGTLLGDSLQTIFYGSDSSPVEVVPESGFRFAGWNDGISDNPRTDNTVLSNLEVTAVYEAITSTDELFNGTMTSVFPNPFNDVIQINSTKAISHISIHDDKGKTVREFNVINSGYSAIIMTSAIPKGVFLLHIHHVDNTFVSKKILK